jgi:hypothetical protein
MASTVFPAAGGGVTKQQTDFTASGTWTAPAGVYSAEFLVVGAGGSGGGLLSSLVTQYTASGGGGGGGVKNINLTVTPGTSYTITIGAKGTGSTGVGANGGFSEVLDGATSLIKCYGGGGGWGLTGIVQVLPTLLNASAGMGGISNGGTTNTRFGGGGGGANPFIDPYGETNSEGSGVKNGGASYPDYGGRSIGNAGFNGYGAGGGGGVNSSAAQIYPAAMGGSSFAGNSYFRTTTGSNVGDAAVANTGCGGGGSVSRLTAGSVSGGDGSDGLVRVVYFA